MGIVGHAASAAGEAAELLAGRFPAFVTDRTGAAGVLAGEIPVFVFHSIAPAEFEAQLAYLAVNGYRTLDCAGFLAALEGSRPAPEKSVLLTIDDARASVWSFGHPLLKKYGMTAVLFVIPGLVPEAAAVTPTLEEVWAGRMAAADLADRDPMLMSWPEIAAMAAAGTADIQSHTLHHHKVPVGPGLHGVAGPAEVAALYDLPGTPRDGARPAPEELLGLPLFEADALMLARPMFRPDPGFVEACRAAWAGPDGALERIRGLAADWRARHGGLGEMRAGAETVAEIRRSLVRSREILETRLGRRVEHLCYPYTLGSEVSVAVSREAGYRSNFWGMLPGRRANRAGDDPFRAVRVKGDFIHRLPGRGRRSLGSVLLGKVGRRLAGRPVH